MANTGTETIVIDSVTKYGGKVNGKSYNLSKKYSGPALEAGKTYKAIIYTADSGAKYVNSAELADAPKPVFTQTVSTGGTVVLPHPPVPVKAGDDKGFKPNTLLSAGEKDNRILIQGILQAVAQAPHLAGSADDDEYIERVQRITAALVEFVRGVK